ncbi:endo-1,4-beta-xylanase 5-like [Oryza glaberrima]|uniref:GH10 domain-containing protein n=1 Tax=Oryza glaberrima TaxID=4538 RepID=I1PU90_ORYGL|nr:endo-1,4-beta-xylanase 5-like [Oryza glaberrima]
MAIGKKHKEAAALSSSSSPLLPADRKALLLLLLLLIVLLARPAASSDGVRYDYRAYTECKSHPEPALYNGGILRWANKVTDFRTEDDGNYSPAFVLYNMSAATVYSFSCWVKIDRPTTAHVKAKILTLANAASQCLGTALVRNDCWSFLKGGFTLNSASETSVLYFQTASPNASTISIRSASLQPFSPEQWNQHREDRIQLNRKRFVNVHVADSNGSRVVGAKVAVHQITRDFPFGSAISRTILGNKLYQEWFNKRFNAAVFENELKWYATEPYPGKEDYTVADQLLQFVQANDAVARGHNIFWEDPKYTPAWVKNLTGSQLRAAVSGRIESLLSRYKGDFVHWDVSNEMLHFDFYENRLGGNATVDFFDTAKRADPLATLFLNDFNVVEVCDDLSSSADSYVSRLRQLADGGVTFEGIGLEGHFGKPNIPYVRAVLDKLGTLRLPIWLTEIDISSSFDPKTQAAYLEEVLREGFAHPSVDGIMLWTAMDTNASCYQMCLTNQNFTNLPAGDVVDKLLGEWQTKETLGTTNDRGSFNFSAFLGEYKLSVTYLNLTAEGTFSLAHSDDTKHINIRLSPSR